MPLAEPPVEAGSLAGFPRVPLRSRTLHRVWRWQLPDGGLREQPWWFASPPDVPHGQGGRFDLAAPMGACYTALSAVGAVLEALQMRLVNLPRAELAIRRRAAVAVPYEAPMAADLTAEEVVGRHGVTAALWAGQDCGLTQRWAAALRRDGWWALHVGVAHDPSGRLRAVTLFDHVGAHPPTLAGSWTHTTATLHDDADLEGELARYGVAVRDPGSLPFTSPP